MGEQTAQAKEGFVWNIRSIRKALIYSRVLHQFLGPNKSYSVCVILCISGSKEKERDKNRE